MKLPEMAAAQIADLQRFAKGDIVLRVEHPRAGVSYIWHHPPGRGRLETIRATSVWKFAKLGWIKNRLPDDYRVEYAITPQGRAALLGVVARAAGQPTKDAAERSNPARPNEFVGAVFERLDGTRFVVEKQDAKYVYHWMAAGSRPQFKSVAIANLPRYYKRIEGKAGK